MSEPELHSTATETVPPASAEITGRRLRAWATLLAIFLICLAVAWAVGFLR